MTIKKGSDVRKAEFDVDKLFLDRWSSRNFTGEELLEEELMSFFEAAKWAPSAFNSQPWRFIYSLKGDENWDRIFGLLGDFNKTWCENASALILVLSKKDSEGKPNKTHSFDTGAAWMSLALQASLKGWTAHGMSGFDYDKARDEFSIPDTYDIEAMIALGKVSEEKNIPDAIMEKENPNGRKSISSIVLKDSKELNN